MSQRITFWTPTLIPPVTYNVGQLAVREKGGCFIATTPRSFYTAKTVFP